MDEMVRKRATGRTARLIEEAKRLVAKGENVVILVDNKRDEKRLGDLVGEEFQGKIAVRQLDMAAFFNWAKLRFETLDQSIPLVDHYAIESRFHSVLEMWERFDRPQEGSAEFCIASTTSGRVFFQWGNHQDVIDLDTAKKVKQLLDDAIRISSQANISLTPERSWRV